MEFSDTHLTCKECGQGFVWTADQQKEYARRGFVNQPARCLACREKSREAKKELAFEIKCSACGKKDDVFLKINKDQPVFCDKCFSALRKKS